MAASALRALSFDGDGTLWDFERAMRFALEHAAGEFERAGLRYAGSRVTADWLRAVREEIVNQPSHIRRSLEEIRLASFEEAVRRCRSRQLVQAAGIFESYMRIRCTQLQLFPEANAVLEDLHSRYALALVTNGNNARVLPEIQRFFDVVVVASDCGRYKPDPAIYQYALEQLKMTPGECLHVGDHPIDDVCAATAAGLRTVWLNRNRAAWNELLKPDFVIGSLSELKSVISVCADNKL
jgi:2-haloalkanoic acid dehalogenase type II